MRIRAIRGGGSKIRRQPVSGSRSFSLTDGWLYKFNSRVAFFALGIIFDEIETLADIVNLGGVTSRAAFSYKDESGSHSFSLAAWIEKLASKAGKWRVPEATLLLTGLFGGAFAEFITMQIIRHKTMHRKFMILLPLEIILHIALLTVAFSLSFK